MLEISNIKKNFGGVKALKGVSTKFYKGEIHGLVGENGAGKSTLMKIISGVYKPTAGEIFLAGKNVKFETPTEAYKAGIRIVYQELSLINSLTIAENVFIHDLGDGKIFKIIKRKELERKAENILREWGIEIKASKKINNVSIGIRQLIEIARELVAGGKIIILDEPTSSLTNKEIDHLFKVVRILNEKDFILVFISHRLDEIIDLADRITVLRDGEVVANSLVRDLTFKQICKSIAGEDINSLYPKIKTEIGKKVIETKNFSGEGFKNISIEVRKGEIVGLIGLVGAGRSELLRGIFGLDKHKGDLYIEGVKVKLRTTGAAIRKGVVLLSENRTEEVFPNLVVSKNIIVNKIKNAVKYGFLNSKLLAQISKKMVKKLNITTYDPMKQVISELSGGSQQKVIFARLLLLNKKVLLLDEPTKGIDVLAKAEIHKIIGEYVKDGGAVLVASSELNEIIGICDRAYILHEGELVKEVERKNFNKEVMLKCMMGLKRKL